MTFHDIRIALRSLIHDRSVSAIRSWFNFRGRHRAGP